MTHINLNKALAIATKYPENYKVVDCSGKGYVNIIRYIKESNGKFTARKQTFDAKTGDLKIIERIVNDKYSICSDPNKGLLGLEYFVKVPDENAFAGYRLKPTYVEIRPEKLRDIKYFLESQRSNMQ